MSGYPDTSKGFGGCIAPSLSPSTAYQRERCRCRRCVAWWLGYYRSNVRPRRIGTVREGADTPVSDAELERQRSVIRGTSLGARQSIAKHALDIVERMIAAGVPDAPAVGIALLHLQEILDDRAETIAKARHSFTQGDAT